MINLPVVKPLYKTRKAAIIVLGGVVLGCVAITAIATYNAPSDPAGAQPGSQEFVAAAKWIKDNKAEYCDMSPEQTLLQMANKTVVGKFTAQEGLQQIVQAANTYGANAEDTLRAQGLFLQALLKPKARALETAQLVNLAIEKNNPTLYAYAIQLCVDPQAAGCGNVGGKQWATMDAENGVAWLATAKDALDANDDAAATVAIETALNAKFFSARTPKLAVQNAPNIRSLPAYNKEVVLMQLLPFEPRDAMHQISLSKYCINKGNARLDRATLCNAMAARLAKDDPSPFGLAVAASIATRFNWEAPKQLAIEANKKAATDHMLNKAVGSNAPIMECMSNPTHGSALNRSAGLAPQNLSTP